MVARQPEKLAQAAAEAGPSAFPITCDLSAVADIERAVIEIAQSAGRIDVLINCASATRFGTALSLTDDEWVSGFEVKVFGALRLMRAAWPHLSAAKGAVVNIAGIGAHTPRDRFAMTGPLSAALLALTKVFADRGLVDGVRVNAVNPGAVLTPRLISMLEQRAIVEGCTLEDVISEMERRDEVTRLGRPEDIANLVAFLLSADGDLLHGAIIDADGGRTKSL